MESLVWEIVSCQEIKSSDIKIQLSKKFNRKAQPKIDETMDAIWREACAKNNRLYNGSKFRLASVELDEFGEIIVNIGITDYKETFCTNFSHICNEIYDFGVLNYNDKYACFGNAIGVGSVVLSNDGFIILIKRSNWVGESKGLLDTPGGHAEPCVNIPETCLSWPVCLGIFRNKLLGGKPGFVFYIKCDLLKDDIEKYYHKGGLETDESTDILFMSLKELKSYTDEEFAVLICDMAPGCQAALHMFKKLYF
ncbi:uridine diphosphate glucose pyrophosphatase NUDT22 isoform X4 [Hydra vulgaris]|uniref:Uridine diphosphate glucose pyrophosphatase NUDT22 isoform X4 n=1 Tax=Hydra vulgaris TaxID=6087 RepID=A0ABM4CIZ0_HYDVU